MRAPADATRIKGLADQLGGEISEPARLYLVGGATAVLEGWRASTSDVDAYFEPETDEILRAISRLKDQLDVNVELASPLDFLPEVPGWRDRSRSRFVSGRLEVLDFDYYSQALSKLERSFDLDLADVEAMVATGRVEPRRLLELFESIEPELFRFPAVEPTRLRRRLEKLVQSELE